MKKLVISLAVAALAIVPAAAKTKPQNAKPLTDAEAAAQQNANSMRILRDGVPLILPSWLLPVYFNMNKDAGKDASKAKAKH